MYPILAFLEPEFDLFPGENDLGGFFLNKKFFNDITEIDGFYIGSFDNGSMIQEISPGGFNLMSFQIEIQLPEVTQNVGVDALNVKHQDFPVEVLFINMLLCRFFLFFLVHKPGNVL